MSMAVSGSKVECLDWVLEILFVKEFWKLLVCFLDKIMITKLKIAAVNEIMKRLIGTFS